MEQIATDCYNHNFKLKILELKILSESLIVIND